jgi:RNA polymerase sigma factor (sigma-70 family)
MPPPASGLPARLVLGPALRAQSDGRLVRLVREGYESAFDEIVRRYRRPLGRFAASIVGGHAEDVTQDSFRKALVALRRGDGEVELRPWLYRIVRNTALNDLRDRPPAAAELAEDLVDGGRSAAVEAEERAEVAKLTARLRALPEKQRAALVMRELEGLSHEEIATALGISGGAARQAIARGRAAVRSGFGALVPLPLLRVLASSGDGATEAAAGAGAAGTGGAAGGLGSALSGAGAASLGAGGLDAGTLKIGLATVIVAGSIGAGVAVHDRGNRNDRSGPPKAAASAPGGPSADGVRSTPSLARADVDHSGRSSDDGIEGATDDRSGKGHDDDHHGRGEGEHHGGRRRGDDGVSTRGDDRGPSHQSGNGGPGPSVEGSGGSGDSSGSGDSGSHGGGTGSSGGKGNGRGSDDAPAQVVGTAPAEADTSGPSSGSAGSSSSGDSGSFSGGSGSSGGSSGGSDNSSASTSTSGSSGGPSPSPDSSTTADDDSHSGGGPGPSGESKISP